MTVLDGYGLLKVSPADLPAEPALLRFRPITMADQPASCAVEDTAFPNPAHRASHEKVSRAYHGPQSRPEPVKLPATLICHQLAYRISRCSDISYGLFTLLNSNPDPASAMARLSADSLRPLITEDEDGHKSVLLAHAVSTRGNSPVVTDTDMMFPENWRDTEASKGSPLGHQTNGRTLCLHSLAVVPEAQRMGIGTLVVKAYIRVMRESGICDRIALLCQSVSYSGSPVYPSLIICGGLRTYRPCC